MSAQDTGSPACGHLAHAKFSTIKNKLRKISGLAKAQSGTESAQEGLALTWVN